MKKHRAFVNRHGCRYKVIEEVSETKALVRFESGFETVAYKCHIRNGKVRDLTFPIVCGVGFTGVGVYSKTKHQRLYSLWTNMLKRCYDSNYHIRYPTYIGCKVVARWHDFQKFCEDITKMDNWDIHGFHLDKDLRKIGNKKYGPQYCSFVPASLNYTFVGKGVRQRGKTFTAYHSNDGNKRTLGTFSTYEEAFKAYLSAKLIEIKSKVKRFKKQLHEEVIKTLLSLTYSKLKTMSVWA